MTRKKEVAQAILNTAESLNYHCELFDNENHAMVRVYDQNNKTSGVLLSTDKDGAIKKEVLARKFKRVEDSYQYDGAWHFVESDKENDVVNALMLLVSELLEEN